MNTAASYIFVTNYKSKEKRVKVESDVIEFAASIVERINLRLSKQLINAALQLNCEARPKPTTSKVPHNWIEKLVNNDADYGNPALKTLCQIVTVLIDYAKNSAPGFPLFEMVDMVNRLIQREHTNEIDADPTISANATLQQRCQAAYNLVEREELWSLETAYKKKCADVLLSYDCFCAAVETLDNLPLEQQGLGLRNPNTGTLLKIKYDLPQYQAKSKKFWEIFRQFCVPTYLETKKKKTAAIKGSDVLTAKEKAKEIKKLVSTMPYVNKIDDSVKKGELYHFFMAYFGANCIGVPRLQFSKDNYFRYCTLTADRLMAMRRFLNSIWDDVNYIQLRRFYGHRENTEVMNHVYSVLNTVPLADRIAPYMHFRGNLQDEYEGNEEESNGVEEELLEADDDQ